MFVTEAILQYPFSSQLFVMDWDYVGGFGSTQQAIVMDPISIKKTDSNAVLKVARFFHPVVASKAVQLVQLVCGVARPSSHLSAIDILYMYEKRNITLQAFFMQELEKCWKMEEEPGRRGEFLLAVGAGEVVRVVDLAAEPQRLTV